MATWEDRTASHHEEEEDYSPLDPKDLRWIGKLLTQVNNEVHERG